MLAQNVWEDVGMEISPAELNQFISIYAHVYGEILSAADAAKQATMLVNYVRLCEVPRAKDHNDDTLERSNESRI